MEPPLDPAIADAPAAAARVVLFTTYFHPVIGGVETHARQLARSLVAAGLGVWVLTKRMDAGTAANDVVDGIPVRRIPPTGPRKSSAKWKLVAPALAELIRKRDSFDIILCIDYRGIGLAALAAGRLLRKPVVFDAETPGALSCANWDPALRKFGIRAPGVLSRIAKWPARALHGHADAYACISRSIEQEAIDQRIASQAVWYLPHTVDTQAFSPASLLERDAARRRLSLPFDRQVVAFVGRLGREKGILDLLEAWRTLRPRNAVLLVVGPDMPGHALDVGPEVRAAAASLPAGQVLLHGPASDVRPLLAAADVFVQPSHYEAFGLSVIEAMSTALPVVATRVGGMAEYLRDNVNGLLCEPHRPEGLSQQIARLLEDPALAERLGREARHTVVDQFDERVVARRWVQMIRSLLSPTVARAMPVASWLISSLTEAVAAWF